MHTSLVPAYRAGMERNPTNLHAQQRAQQEQERKARVANDLELADMRWLMSNAQGRRHMWRLLDKAGVFRTSFTGNSTTFFNEGQRNIGLMMIDQIHAACPELYTVMVNEARDERKALENAR